MSRIGIDLGTTNTVMACCSGHGPPEVVPSRQNLKYVPASVALRRDGVPLVGQTAKTRWPEVFCGVHRLIGRSFADPVIADIARRVPFQIAPLHSESSPSQDLTLKLGDVEMTPVQVCSEILRRMKMDAEFRLGQPVTHAVLTVPDYFADSQRIALRKAGKLAGLRVSQILEESLAIAIALQMMQDVKTLRRALIYDLGGATFKCTLMTIADGSPMIEATMSDLWCGGDDFDYQITEHVLEVQERRDSEASALIRQNQKLIAQLKDRAEAAKIELSQCNTTDVVMLSAARLGKEEIDIEVTVQRDDFERWIRPTIAHTISLTRTLMEKASLSPKDIDHVVAAGGSTHIPLVRKMLGETFGPEKLRTGPSPMDLIALGAAIRSNELRRIICPLTKCSFANPEDAEACAGVTERGSTCGFPLQGIAPKRVCQVCGSSIAVESSTCPKGHPSSRLRGKVSVPYGIALAGGRFHVLVPKEVTFPFEEPLFGEFQTTRPGQKEIRVEVYQGCESIASRNERLGVSSVAIPDTLRDQAGLKFRIGLTLDEEGVPTVSVRGMGTLATVHLDQRLAPSAEDLLHPGPEGALVADARAERQAPGEWLAHSGPPGEALKVMCFVLDIAEQEGRWFLSQEARRAARQLRQEAQQALESDDQAAIQELRTHLVETLFWGAFCKQIDLIMALAHRRGNPHLSRAQRGRLGTLLSEYKKEAKETRQIEEAERKREQINIFLNELTRNAGGSVDLTGLAYPDRVAP